MRQKGWRGVLESCWFSVYVGNLKSFSAHREPKGAGLSSGLESAEATTKQMRVEA